MNIKFSHEPSNRHIFDAGECSSSEGFIQCDTKQDAYYFGIWINPTDLKITSYCEGDVCREIYDTRKEFNEAVRKMADSYIQSGWGFVIDVNPEEVPGIEDLTRRK